VVDRRVGNLRNAGIEVEYRKYKNAGHGFGLGVGFILDSPTRPTLIFQGVGVSLILAQRDG
jgi:acetyl esterase/lipase